MIPRAGNLLFYRPFISTKAKRSHRLHDKPFTTEQRRKRRAELRAKGKLKRGDAYGFVRMCLYAWLNRSETWWPELDLVKIANARGLTVGWVRKCFWRLMADPAVSMNIKARLHQKRLKKNGTFVIVIAKRARLMHDCEPYFYHADETTRHLRCRLREEDLAEPNRRGNALTRSSILQFSSSGQQIDKNKTVNGQNQSSVATGDTDSSNCNALTALGNEKGNESPKTLKETSHNDLRPNLNCKKPQWVEGQLLSDVGRKSLNRKVKQTFLECRGFHYDNCKVKFEGSLAWVFIFQAMRNGQPDALIERAWEYGIKKAHADAVDGLARIPCALALSHSRRFLERHTTGTLQERIDANYRKKNFKKRQANWSSKAFGAHSFPSSQQWPPLKENSSNQSKASTSVAPASVNAESSNQHKNETPAQKKHSNSWAEKVNAALDKIMPAGFHPGQVQTGGSPGASGQAAVPTPPPQMPAKTKPGYQAKNSEDAAASKRGVAHLHGFLSSLEEEDRQERLKAQAKKDIKKS